MATFQKLIAVLGLFFFAVPVYSEDKDDKIYEQWRRDLVDDDPTVRIKALMQAPRFAYHGKDGIALLLQDLRDPDPKLRERAIFALWSMPIPRDRMAEVVRLVGTCIGKDGSNAISYQAINTLHRFGADARPVIGDLLRGFEAQNFEIREAVIDTLLAVGVDGKNGPDPRVTDALIRRTMSRHEKASAVRWKAILALGMMGPPHDPKKLAEVISTLKASANHDSSPKVMRLVSWSSLMLVERKINQANLKNIVDSLHDDKTIVRRMALECLAVLLERTRQPIPDILRILQSEKELEVLWAAYGVLYRLTERDQRLFKTLHEQTQRKDPELVPVVLSACEVLIQMEALQVDVIQALDKFLARKDLEEWVRRDAQKTRSRIHALRCQVEEAVEQVLKRADLEEKNKALLRKAIENIRQRSGDTSKKPEGR